MGGMFMLTPVVAEEFLDNEDKINAIVEADGPFSARLFEPLMSFAAEQQQLGYFDEAEETLEWAQNVLHRNEGVHTPRQFPVLDQLAELRLEDKDPVKADRLHKFKFFLATRHFEDLDRVPAYFELTDWYLRTGQYIRSRRLMEDAIELIQQTGSDTDLRLIEAHRNISRARRLAGMCCSEKPLLEALAILDLQPDTNTDLRRAITRDLADSLVIHNKPQQALVHYQQAVAMGLTNDEPRLLSMSGKLKVAERQRRDYYAVKKDSPFNVRFEKMTDEEALSADNQEPQTFVVPDGLSNRFGVAIRDSHTRVTNDEFSKEVIGKPFQFYLEQLRLLVPIKLESSEEMSALEVRLSFSVLPTGRTDNVKIEQSNAPRRLNRMLRDTVKRARYRPALVEGVPVATHNVEVVQVFRRSGG